MCDTLVATPDYTATGTMILAKNSDREPNEAQVVVRYPHTRHKSKKLRVTYIEIPQVKETNEVVLSKPFQMWGAEMGVNEHGVAIGNEAVFTKITPRKKNTGLTGMDLLRLALERSRNAAAALECITELLAEFGQDACGGYENKSMFYFNSYIIADPKEAWVLETVDRHWVAAKVVGFRSISNGLTIETDFDLASEQVKDFAQRQGLTRGQDFNFRRVFSDRFYTHFSQCKVRQALSTELGRQGAKHYDVKTAMQILRSHYAERTDPARTGMHSLCMHASGLLTPSQTTGSMVAELRPSGKSTYWFTGTAAPCLSLFKPLFIPGKYLLAGTFAEPTARCDASLWWRHELLHRRALANLEQAKGLFLAERDAVENGFVRAERLLYKKSAAEREKFSRSAWDQAGQYLTKWTEKVQAARLRSGFHPLYHRFWKQQNRRAGIVV